MLCAARRSEAGITPAHAGKRNAENLQLFQVWDHPRTCGEKKAQLNLTAGMLGSPPHMRGKVTLRIVDAAYPGITPAHAGKR